MPLKKSQGMNESVSKTKSNERLNQFLNSFSRPSFLNSNDTLMNDYEFKSVSVFQTLPLPKILSEN